MSSSNCVDFGLWRQVRIGCMHVQDVGTGHWIWVRLGADLVGLAPEYDHRTSPLTMPCTCNSSTPIGPFDVQTGCIESSEWGLQAAWVLAYDVRCASSACMFKMEALDFGEAWRRPGRAVTVAPTIPEWANRLHLESSAPIGPFKLQTGCIWSAE